MSLYISSKGHGPDVVLLHGWAMHGGVFDEVVQHLCPRYRVHCIDLPGHGRSALSTEVHDVDSMVDALQSSVPEQSVLLGWSLGGLLSLYLATRIPLRGLVTINSTPRFVANNSWPHGMEPEVFTQFSTRLQQNFAGTVDDFLRLQVRGDADAPHTLKLLKERLLQHSASHAGLQLGLEILRDADARSLLPSIDIPALVVGGEHDRIAHPDAAVWTAAQLPQGRAHIVKRAGHAPFISHRGEFLTDLDAFLAEAGL